ncbi:MAG: hypothetical protein HC880_07195 [Bacteroidia bacterium]|nr:hypothetical protein [Bacteroidia bacterium]
MEKLDTWTPTEPQTTYQDQNLALNHIYQYLIAVYDSSTNQSRVHSQRIYYETGWRETTPKLNAQVDQTQHRIIIRWRDKNPGVSKCIIYRAWEDQPLKLYRTLSGNPGEFIDQNIQKKGITPTNCSGTMLMACAPRLGRASG